MSPTPREKEVLALLCQGKANKLIAHDLGIAEATVKVMVRQLMKKSGATSRTQLVVKILTARVDTAEKRVKELEEARGLWPHWGDRPDGFDGPGGAE